jgi:hypothetical protein
MENHRTDSTPNDSYPVKSDRLLDSWTLTPQGDHLMSQSDQLKRQRGATRFVPSVIQYGNIAAKPALSEMNHRYARI